MHTYTVSFEHRVYASEHDSNYVDRKKVCFRFKSRLGSIMLAFVETNKRI